METNKEAENEWSLQHLERNDWDKEVLQEKYNTMSET